MYNKALHISLIILITTILACDSQQLPVTLTKKSKVLPRTTSNINKVNPLTIPIPNSEAQFLPPTYLSPSEPNLGITVDTDFEKMTSLNLDHINLELPPQELKPYQEEEYEEPLRQTRWMLRLYIDNDIYNNTDYYYTHGTNIELVTPFALSSPLNKILAATKQRDLEMGGFTLVQNIYTPIDPDAEEIQIGDRPFSAYLMLGQFREVYDFQKHLFLKSSISIGVIGASSAGGTIQSSIHEIAPLGWQNQINNDFLIDYSFDVRKGLVSKSFYEFNITGSARIGTLYTEAGGGFDMRIGKFMADYWGPVTVFKNHKEKSKYQFWFFVRGSTHLIAYDATLQGGLFNTGSPYTISTYEVNPFVFKASAGLALYSGNLGIELENNYLSPEFEGAKPFLWGRIKIAFSF